MQLANARRYGDSAVAEEGQPTHSGLATAVDAGGLQAGGHPMVETCDVVGPLSGLPQDSQRLLGC